MVAGVGGGVPAVRSAPLSVVAGAGVPSFALVSPGSGGGGAGHRNGGAKKAVQDIDYMTTCLMQIAVCRKIVGTWWESMLVC